MLAAAVVPLTTPMAPVNTTLRATDARRDVARRRHGDDVAILNVAVDLLIGRLDDALDDAPRKPSIITKL